MYSTQDEITLAVWRSTCNPLLLKDYVLRLISTSLSTQTHIAPHHNTPPQIYHTMIRVLNFVSSLSTLLLSYLYFYHTFPFVCDICNFRVFHVYCIAYMWFVLRLLHYYMHGITVRTVSVRLTINYFSRWQIVNLN